MLNNKKFHFFDQLYYAVIKPKQYYRLTKVSGGRMTGFVFLFLLITSLFTIIPMFYSMMGPHGISQVLREELPDFEMKDGELSVSERYEFKEEGVYVLIDTDVDSFSAEDIDRSNYQVMLISRTNLINYQSFGGRVQSLDFSNFRMLSFDNSIINVIIPFIYIILVFASLFIYALEVAAYFFTALLYSILSLIVSVISNARLTFATNYKTAIYGKVTAYILSAIISATGLILPGYALTGIAILITCAYVVFGTISHTSEDAYEEAGISADQIQ